MPYSIARDEKLDVTRIVFKGRLDLGELMGGMREARAVPGHSYRTLFVVSPDTEIALSSADIRMVAEALRREREADAPHGRSAVVAPGALAFGLARMLQAYWEESPSDLRVFHDEREALDWLVA